MHGLLLGHDELVSEWAFKTYRIFKMPVNRAIGIVDNNGIHGAIILQNYNGFNIELSYYGENTLSPGIVHSIARIVVNEFNASRLTVTTNKRNRGLIVGLGKLGFRLEGAQRCYYGRNDCDRNTGVRLVMFRERLDKLAGITHEEEKAN